MDKQLYSKIFLDNMIVTLFSFQVTLKPLWTCMPAVLLTLTQSSATKEPSSKNEIPRDHVKLT